MSFQSDYACYILANIYGFNTAFPGMYEFEPCFDTDYSWARFAETTDGTCIYFKFENTEFPPYVSY